MRAAAVWAGLVLLLVVAGTVSVLIGPAGLPDSEILHLRLIRLALGTLAGGVLALVGASLQGLLRNPLVDPFTLGVSSGAALGASLVIALGAATSLLLPVAGFAGALVTMLAVYLLARVRGRVTVTGLVLAGVIMSFLFSSLVMLVMVVSRQPLARAVYLLMGYLGTPFTRGSLWLFAGSAAAMVAGSVVLVLHARDLDIASLSERTAMSLGVDTARLTRTVFIVGSALVGLVVSFAGAVSFVGLVVPHLVRLALGPGHRRVLPGSFLLGASLLLFADTVTRSVGSGVLPLSVVTSLLGVPFFVYLLRKRL